MKRKVKSIALTLIVALILQMIPSKVFAFDLSTNDSKTQKITRNWEEYSLITTSGGQVDLSGSDISINGNVHSDNDFKFFGSKLTISGICDAVGKVNNQGSLIDIKEVKEHSEEISIPNILQEIKNNDKETIEYNKEQVLSNKDVSLDKQINTTQNIEVKDSNVELKSSIISSKNITLNIQKITRNDLYNPIFLVSENSDITINSNDVSMKGILYAPNGNININSSSFKFEGKIIAKNIIYRGSLLEVKDYVDTNSKDEDNDGMPDDFEKNILIPSMIDHNIDLHNPEPNEDYDGDGLTNLEEYKIGTNPSLTDTDGDGIRDYDEVYKYHTNPTLYDTDEDGMGDGAEIKNNLNPLEKDTNKNGVIDSEEIIKQSLVDDKYKDIDINKTLVKPELTITGKGDFNKKLEIKDLSLNNEISNINSKVGSAFDFKHDEEVSFTSANIKFQLSDQVLQKHKLGNLKVAYFNTNNNEITILDTYVNEKEKTISAEVEHFSCYFVIDEEDYYYDIDVLQSNSKVDHGKADVVFTIDTTGSMWGPIGNVKNNINAVVDKLKINKVDVRLGLVEYRDIYADGKYSTKDHGWFQDTDSFKKAVNNLYANGGGDWEESAVDGLEKSRNKDFRSSVNKYIILITDAPYKNGIVDDPYFDMDKEIELLKKDNISTSVVTNSASKSSYERLYSETNGIIANIDGDFVTVLEPLIQRMSDISGEGTWIRLANGSIVKLDKDPSLGDMTVDTDRDGVPDLLELRDEIKKTYYSSGELKSYKCWTTISNPVMKDTDGDGIGDNSDIYPSRFDINVVDENNEYIKLNTGKTWTKFCEEIYSYHDLLSKTTMNIRTAQDYERFKESELYKKLQVLIKNRDISWNEDELFIIQAFDINGVRDYLTIERRDLVNSLYTRITGNKPHYYKHTWFSGWVDKGETPIEGNFFTGSVVSDAEATLTVYHDVDLIKVVQTAIIVGVFVGGTYLALGEVALIVEGIEIFGAYNAFTMYFNGGSTVLSNCINDYKDFHPIQTIYHATGSEGAANSVAKGIDKKYFRTDNRFGAGFYVGNDKETIIRELDVHGNNAAYYVEFDMNLAKQKVLDLTNRNIAKDWGFELNVSSNYECQQIALKAREQGYTVIKVGSYRGPGTNYIVYENFEDILNTKSINLFR